MVPVGVIRPMLFALAARWVNQRLPSGPATMSFGWLLGVGVGNSVTAPLGVIRVTSLVLSCTNQKFPSAPWASPWLSPFGAGNSLMTPGGTAAALEATATTAAAISGVRNGMRDTWAPSRR